MSDAPPPCPFAARAWQLRSAILAEVNALLVTGALRNADVLTVLADLTGMAVAVAEAGGDKPEVVAEAVQRWIDEAAKRQRLAQMPVRGTA